ncbi:MAG TPA: hypothetical protein VL527_17725 [Dongiaceae bacterium]|nr:hypothetical protein [Dongiaceae bacterium]
MKALLKNLAVFLIGIIFSGLTAQGQDQTNKLEEPRVPLIQMVDVPLGEAIKNLAREAKLNIIIDPKITDASRIKTGNTNLEAPVNLRWEDLSAKQALARLLEERKLFLVRNPQIGVAKIGLTNAPPRTFNSELLDASGEIIPLIEMRDVPLKIALNALAEKSKLKLEFVGKPEGLSGEVFVNVRFEELIATQALAAICDQYDLQIGRVKKVRTWRIFLSE